MAQPALSFEPEPVPRLPGPAVGPKGPKICQKPGAGFTILSSQRSAQRRNCVTVRKLIPGARVSSLPGAPGRPNPGTPGIHGVLVFPGARSILLGRAIRPPKTFKNPAENLRFRIQTGPQNGRNQAKNARGGARKLAQTESDRFRAGIPGARAVLGLTGTCYGNLKI